MKAMQEEEGYAGAVSEQGSDQDDFFASFLKVTRFGNLAIIGFGQYFTSAFLINQQTVFDYHLLLLSCSTILIAAAGYIINDYYDVKIDYINKPERVVIGKSITRRYAILFHIVLSVAGILIGVYLSWSITALNVVSVFLLWLYSNNLKRLPFVGNVTVAVLTGASIYSLEILYRTGNPLVMIFAIFALFITLVREIIKDIEDLKGDNTFGCKTLPIVLGIRRTKFIIYTVILTFALIVIAFIIFSRPYPFSTIFFFFLFPCYC